MNKQQEDILCSNAEALVNPVNCVGTMGKGLALQFKTAYPKNFYAYVKLCRTGRVRIGEVFIFALDDEDQPPRYIINFPTKRDWRDASKLQDIQAGLEDLVRKVVDFKIGSIAVPALGCGLGGLDWQDVKPLIVQAFEPLTDVKLILFEP